MPRIQQLIYNQIGKTTGVADPLKQNLALLTNTVDSLSTLEHVAVVTGGRHYGMHLGPTLYPGYRQPYVEDQTPRGPGPNWYYDLEDALQSSTAGWSWTVLRPSFLMGVVTGGAHNLATALGVYAALSDAVNEPLTFLGDDRSAQVRTDLTDARQLARAGIWSTSTAAAKNQAFNVASGAPFCWHELWPAFAKALGRTGQITATGVSLAAFMEQHAGAWAKLADAHDLVVATVQHVALPEYADQMMLLDWDAQFDVAKLKAAGFDDFAPPVDVLLRIVSEMQDQQLIPPPLQ